jgi:hypothetical protein
MADLKGKVGIVTGGGTGIGRATALAMSKVGAGLVIVCPTRSCRTTPCLSHLRPSPSPGRLTTPRWLNRDGL